MVGSIACTKLDDSDPGVKSRARSAAFLFLSRALESSRMSDFYCDEVLSGKTPVQKLFETENALAYYHTRPFWETHIVVIPKRHVDSLLTIDDNGLLIELMGVVKQVAAKVVEEKGAARVLTNLGEYQDSKHLHFHVNSGGQIV